MKLQKECGCWIDDVIRDGELVGLEQHWCVAHSQEMIDTYEQFNG